MHILPLNLFMFAGVAEHPLSAAMCNFNDRKLVELTGLKQQIELRVP
jgi:hypothetical protein